MMRLHERFGKFQLKRRRTVTPQKKHMSALSQYNNNSDLIDALARQGIVHNKRVIKAMKEVTLLSLDLAHLVQVDRADFCTKREYEDSPQEIGSGQTISAPHMHVRFSHLIFLSYTS